MSEESGGPGAPFGRKALAVLACGAALVPYVAVCVVLLYHFAGPVFDWVDRQDGVWGVVCKIVVGLGLMMMLGVGGGLAEEVWKSVAGRQTAEEGDAAGESDEAGSCPKCGFRDVWDGVKCGHCGHSIRPWSRGARPAD